MITKPTIRFSTGAVVLGLLLFISGAARAGTEMVARTREAVQAAAPDAIPCSLWLTGQVFIRHGLLLFHTDVPVRADNHENVVFLGATRKFAPDLLPEYLKAAATGAKVRLYGALVLSGPLSGLPDMAPPVEFITWKMHAPTQPDTLPPSRTNPLTSTSVATFPDSGVNLPTSTIGIPIHETTQSP